MHAEEGIVIMLIGNKLDLIDEEKMERKVQIEDVKEFCKNFALAYEETSAKTGFNVKESFEELINQIYSKNKKLGSAKDEPYENLRITPENYQQNNMAKQKSSDSSCSCN